MIEFLIIVGVLFSILNVCQCDLNVVYQWDKIDLTLQENAQNLTYIPDNNVVYRMKIWNNTLYMAIPRFKKGVPATLCKSHEGAIKPFPSLGLQKVGNCFNMQNVKDIEIDHLGQLWTLDVGKVNELEPTTANGVNVDDHAVGCDPKLFVIDLKTGSIVRSAVIPPIYYTSQSILSGISLDLKTLTAIIGDVGPDPGFIVYNFQMGIYRKFPCKELQSNTELGYNEALLAVSPIVDMLYFSTVHSNNLYTIPLSVFSVRSIFDRYDVSHYANNQGPKMDTSTAMIMDTTGNLYLGLTRKVVAWNTLKNGFDIKELYIQEVRLNWISSFAFDSNGYLWVISLAFRDFLDKTNSRRTTVKIFKRYCGTTSFALQQTMNTVEKNTVSVILRNFAETNFTNHICISTLLMTQIIIFTYNFKNVI